MKFVEDKIEYIHQEPGFEGGMKMAELAAILHFCGQYGRDAEGNFTIGFQTENEAVSEEPVEEELPVAELAEEVEVETDAVVEEVENEVVAEEVEQPAEAPVRKSFWKIILKAIMWLAISVAVLMAAYVAVAHLCPQWIDQFLYTPEELELLNNR